MFALSTIALVPLALTSWPVHFSSNGEALPVEGVPKSFDCAMRKLAYSYGKQLTPRQDKFESLWYALDLNDPNCHVGLSDPTGDLASNASVISKQLDPISTEGAILVSPGESIQDAIELAVAAVASDASTKPTVLLRHGTHYLPDTIFLGPQHSGLTLASYPGEQATVSGGKVLNAKWTSYNTSGGANIWVADVKGQVDEHMLYCHPALCTRFMLY